MSRLPDKARLFLLGMAAGLIIAAETSALLWSAKLLEELSPSLGGIAGIGAAFFGVCNALVRFVGDRLRVVAGEKVVLSGSLVMSMVGFLVLGVSGSFVVSVGAFACVGFGLALLIPLIFGMAARFVPENRAGALSFVSLLTAGPRVFGPVVFGVVSASFGTAVSFGLVAGCLGVALALMVVFWRLCRSVEGISGGMFPR